MIRFETVNELALKVTCQGGGVLYTKAGAFIAGESAGRKNYTFEKVLFGPQQGLLIGKAHMIGGARVQRRAQAPCAEMEIRHVETGTNAERAFVLSESGQTGRKGKQTQ